MTTTNNSVDCTTLPNYLPEAGGTMAGNIAMGSNKITGLATPTAGTDAANKAYVDQTALISTAVYAASTGTLGTVTQSGAGIGATLTNAGAQATFALDSVNPPVGSNVLIKNTSTGATAANQGIYVVSNAGSNSTNWILTRASSYDTPEDIADTGLIAVQNGSTLASTVWFNTSNIITVDTTNFSFSQFGGGTVSSIATSGLASGGTITTTGTITVTAASKAQQEAASSNIVAVTPANQQYHPSAVNAWASATVSAGTATIQQSYNVSSISNLATGAYGLNPTVTWANNYPCAVGGIYVTGLSPVLISNLRNNNGPGNPNPIIYCMTTGGSLTDPSTFSLGGLGAQ